MNSKFKLNDEVVDSLGNDPNVYIVIGIILVNPQGYFYHLRGNRDVGKIVQHVPEYTLTLREDNCKLI